MTESIRISYELTEVLDNIRKDQATGFAKLDALLGAKASKGDVEALALQLRTYQQTTEGRLASLELSANEHRVAQRVSQEHEGRFLTRKQSRLAAIYALLTLAALVVGPLLAAKVH